MLKLTPRLLGGVAGAVVALSWVAWSRLSPPPCPGALFIDFQPPLLQPGPYHFALYLDDAKTGCEFDVPLPTRQPVHTGRCGMRLELHTQGKDADVSVTGLTAGASPKKLHLVVTRGPELLYDQTVAPSYAAELTPRSESQHFCGKRAEFTAACQRGTSQCLPFAANCDGPEDCANRRVCCASPEAGRSYGYKLATRCTTASYCISRLAHIACHDNDDCPKDMVCTDASFRGEFQPAVTGCQSKPAQ